MILLIAKRSPKNPSSISKDIHKINVEAVPDKEAREIIEAVISAIPELRNHLKSDGSIDQLDAVSKILQEPDAKMTHKLKLSIHIIPLILSSEAEISFNSSVNFRSLWDRLPRRPKWPKWLEYAFVVLLAVSRSKGSFLLP